MLQFNLDRHSIICHWVLLQILGVCGFLINNNKKNQIKTRPPQVYNKTKKKLQLNGTAQFNENRKLNLIKHQCSGKSTIIS